jgi:hypothetical protein
MLTARFFTALDFITALILAPDADKGALSPLYADLSLG